MSNNSLIDFSPNNMNQKPFTYGGMDSFPFIADSAHEGKQPLVKSKFFTSGQSDLILDPLERNKVAVDFETLSIPEGPINGTPIKGSVSFLESSTKIQSDFLVGEKRLSGAREIGELLEVGKPQHEMMEVLSIDNEIATKRPRHI
jgi:hypothetical protein